MFVNFSFIFHFLFFYLMIRWFTFYAFNQRDLSHVQQREIHTQPIRNFDLMTFRSPEQHLVLHLSGVLDGILLCLHSPIPQCLQVHFSNSNFSIFLSLLIYILTF